MNSCDFFLFVFSEKMSNTGGSQSSLMTTAANYFQTGSTEDNVWKVTSSPVANEGKII